MTGLFGFYFFALGAIVASFVGVIAGRLNTGESFLRGRSRCDSCGKTLHWVSLVPILSFFVSRGRSHCCYAQLSPVSPITEAVLGTLFLLAYLKLGITATLFLVLISFSILLGLVLYDLAHQILPPVLLYPFVGVSLIAAYLAGVSLSDFSQTFLTAFLIGLSLALIHFLSRGRAMGFADAPFAFGLALLAGQVALSGFLFSFWIGGAIGIIVLLRRPKGSRMGIEVPFAPFLAAGFLLAYFTQWNPFDFTALLLSLN